MNLQSLVVVVLRICALKFLLAIALTFLPQLYLFNRPEGESPWSNPLTFIYILVVAALITGCFMLWSLALPLARRITKDVPLDLSFGSLSRLDCYSIVFMGVGVWLAAAYFAAVLNWMHYLFRLGAVGAAPLEQSFSQVNKYDISASVIPFAAGIILFLNGRRWAHRLAQRDEKAEKLEAERTLQKAE